MAPNPRRIAARLDALYAQLPTLRCQGLCADSCGPLPAGAAEAERIVRRTGRALAASEILSEGWAHGNLEGCLECSMLKDGRCEVYDIRPMICRLWGMAEDLRCPYGCVPEGGLLSVAEGLAFLAECYDIAGWPPGQRSYAREEIRALASDPRARALLISHHRPTVAGRNASLPPTAIERGRVTS